MMTEQLKPKSVNDKDIRKTDGHYKEHFKQNYDRRHGAKNLPNLQRGDDVLIKFDSENAWNHSGTIIAADPENRTYLVNTPTGVFRRNRKHLQKVTEQIRHDMQRKSTLMSQRSGEAFDRDTSHNDQSFQDARAVEPPTTVLPSPLHPSPPPNSDPMTPIDPGETALASSGVPSPPIPPPTSPPTPSSPPIASPARPHRYNTRSTCGYKAQTPSRYKTYI